VDGIIYGSICAIGREILRSRGRQQRGHLGFAILGLFALNVKGMYGGGADDQSWVVDGLRVLASWAWSTRYIYAMLDDWGGLERG